MHLLAQLLLRSNAEAIYDQKHADQKFWINGGATRVAVVKWSGKFGQRAKMYPT